MSTRNSAVGCGLRQIVLDDLLESIADRAESGVPGARLDDREHGLPDLDRCGDRRVESVEQHPGRVDRLRCRSGVERAFELVEPVADERDEDAVTIAELVVQRADRDAGTLGETAHREALDPAGGDELTGGLQHLGPSALLSVVPAGSHGAASIEILAARAVHRRPGDERSRRTRPVRSLMAVIRLTGDWNGVLIQA